MTMLKSATAIGGTFVFVLCAFLSAGQNNSCACTDLFGRMTAKLEANYIGYHLRKAEIEKPYDLRKEKYKTLAANTQPEDCTKLMQEFLRFFGDGHLFVSEFPNFSAAELAATRELIKMNRIADVNRISFSRNPIEGYWTDGSLKLAIARNRNKKIPYDYVAMITGAEDTSRIGEIKCAFSLRNKVYEGKYYTSKYASRYVRLDPGKDNSLLSVWGGITWGRLTDKNAPVYDPALPVFSIINDKTSVLAIPSFLADPKAFNKVLNDHRKELLNSENLVVDIRGNAGGNALYWPLLTILYERPLTDERGYALSSEDNLAYFKKFSTGKEQDPYKPVVESMSKGFGKMVEGPDFPTQEQEQLVPHQIQKVVILADRSNKSAAESFILHARAVSSRITVMGENTGGVIDYNNVNMVPLGCEKHGIYFGYPTFTYSKDILTRGYNKTGIPPDIRIDSQVPDKLQFVLKYLMGSGK